MWEECHTAGRLSKCQLQKLDGASFQGEMACLDSLLTKKLAQRGFSEIAGIIHHVQSLYPHLTQISKDRIRWRYHMTVPVPFESCTPYYYSSRCGRKERAAAWSISPRGAGSCDLSGCWRRTRRIGLWRADGRHVVWDEPNDDRAAGRADRAVIGAAGPPTTWSVCEHSNRHALSSASPFMSVISYERWDRR